jgi:DNA-binding beta-propeller fold protein YncE
VTLKPHSSKAGTGIPADGVMRPFERRHCLIAIGLILAIGATRAAFSAQSNSGQSENVRIIKASNRTVLPAPEPDPLNMPSDAAVGPEGNLYVLDGVNHRVVVYDAEGNFRFQFGSHGSEPGQLLFPLGIAAAPDGKVYVADSGNHRFQVFESDGKLTETVSLPNVPSGIPPDPADIVVDPNRQRLYITDNDNHHVLVYNLTTHRFESTWGSPGQGERQFRFPFLMDISSQGYLFIVEPINTRVQVINPEGKFVNFIGGWGVKAGQLFRPKGIAVNEDKVLVSDSYLGSIQVFNTRGGFLGVLADAAGVPMKFTTPTGIAIDKKRKRLYVVELKANRISRVDLE